MKLVRKYPYKHYNRFSDTTGRKYLVDSVKVPSVTTILGATKDKRFVDNWRRKVGNEEADRIMRQASTIGTEMHQVLEYTLNGQGYYNAMEEGTKPRMMAKTILDNIKINLQAPAIYLHCATENLVLLIGNKQTSQKKKNG